MQPVSQDALIVQRLRNLAQGLLLLAGLAVMPGALGWLLAGSTGVVWALVLVVIVAAFAGTMPARVVLARSGAIPLARPQAAGLYRIVDELARRARLEQSPSLHLVPSARINAFAVGTRSAGGVAVTEGLLRSLGGRELIGVLAHEISHLRNNDTWVMALAAVMSQLTLWLATVCQLLLILYLPWIWDGEFRGLWLWLLVLMVLPTLSTLVQLALSRNREFAADLEAAALTGDPEGLARALAILERHHGTWLDSIFLPRGGHLPDLPWLRTHPPTSERIRRLIQTVEAPPESARRVIRYQWDGQLPRLRRSQPGGWWSL